MPQSEDIFQMSINHGQKVKNGTYAYIVYGGNEKASKAFANMPINIRENSTDIQAITWGDDYIGASFYNAGKILKTKDWEIKVSAPCALMFEKEDGNYKLSVTDAQMDENLKTIEVKTTLKIKGSHVTQKGKWNIVSVSMPQGKWCGKPVTVKLTSN